MILVIKRAKLRQPRATILQKPPRTCPVPPFKIIHFGNSFMYFANAA